MAGRDHRVVPVTLFALAIGLEATIFGAVAPAEEVAGAHAGGHGGGSPGLDPWVAAAALFTAVAALAFPFFVRTLDDDRDAGEPDGDGVTTAEPAAFVRDGLALLATSAAAIHFAVVWEHLEEFALFGVLFGAAAVLQLAWAALIILRPPSRRLLLAGAIGNAGLFAVWLLSRSAGLPIGPEPWTPEPVGVADVLATVLEVAIVCGVLALVGRGAGSFRLAPRVGAVGTWLLALLLVPLTALALLAAIGTTFWRS